MDRGRTLRRYAALSLHVRAFGRSEVGQVRRRNEDSLAVEPSQGIIVVADGMGGAPGGDVASAMAVQEVVDGLHGGEGMGESIRRANRKILEMVEAGPTLAGMGTTLTALKVSSEAGAFVVGHVGDSRAYLLSDGVFSQISRDHTIVRDMVDAGKIPPSAEREHPLGHILSRVLGTERDVEVDLIEGAAKDGDCFLLCSDGLAKVMDEEEVEGWVRRAGSEKLEKVVNELVEEGNRRGAPDNITVAFLVLDGSPLS
ncbi:MAG: protein phosphatase 2C domain-containing protein [Gemmatimonadota bacterium]